MKIHSTIIESVNIYRKKADGFFPKVLTSGSFTTNKPTSTITFRDIFFGDSNPKRIQIETQKHLEKAIKSSEKIAKQAEEILNNIQTFFQNYLNEYNLSQSIQLFTRSKSKLGATTKAKKATLQKYNELSSTITDLQNIKLKISEILPTKSKNEPPIFKKMRIETKNHLKTHYQDETLSLQKIREIINPKIFKEKYGKDGEIFTKKILSKAKKILAKKIVEGFDSIGYKQREISNFSTDINQVSNEIRDAIGVRFTIKPPHKNLNNLPIIERVKAFENHMSNQINQLTEMLIDICQTTDSKMNKVALYGGENRYFSPKNIQRLNSLEDLDIFETNLPNGYITTQGKLVMKVNHNGKNIPVKVEFQIRGEEVNKFAEVEHIPYDLREGKKLDFKKYSPEQRKLLNKIEKESKRINEDTSLKTAYNEYLKKCYNYHYAKDYGIDLPLPNLPKGISEVLNQENLFKLSHS